MLDIRRLEHVKVITFLMLTFTAFHFHVNAEEPSHEAAVDLAESVIQEDSGDGAIISQHLRYLSAAHGNLEAELAFMRRCVKGLERIRSKQSLPAIEALLRRQDFLNGDLKARTPRLLIARIRESLTPLWFDLRWEDASEAEKIGLALFGIRPDPPISPAHDVAVDRAKSLGEPVRKPLYAILLDPDVNFEVTPWVVNAASHAVELLNEPGFSPTKEEVREVLVNGGPYGRWVMIRYASMRQRKEVAQALNNWFQEHQDSPARVYVVLPGLVHYADAPGDIRREISNVLMKTSQYSQRELVREQQPLRSSVLGWDSVLSSAHQVLERLGVTRDVRRYFQKYLHDRENGELKSVGRSEIMHFADKFAQGALVGADAGKNGSDEPSGDR